MLKQALASLLVLAGSTVAGLAAAPLPEAAKGVPIPPDKGYYVKEIADGLYWVTEGVYTTMFLTTGEGVIVVDAPPSFGDKLVKAIAEVTNEPITHVIYSHAHADHIGGAGRYPGVGDLHRPRGHQGAAGADDRSGRRLPMACSSAARRCRCRPSPSTTPTR